MSKPFIHAQSSAKKFGGVYSDYLAIHELLDSSKSVISDGRHRALTHNTWFISQIIPKIFGEVFTRQSDGVVVSSRDVAEQHVSEDYANRYIPTAQDFLDNMDFQDWMNNGKGKPPSHASLTKKREILKIKHD